MCSIEAEIGLATGLSEPLANTTSMDRVRLPTHVVRTLEPVPPVPFKPPFPELIALGDAKSKHIDNEIKARGGEVVDDKFHADFILVRLSTYVR